MIVELNTTPEELIEDIADKLSESDREVLVKRIERFGEQQVLREMFKAVPNVTLSSWYLQSHDRELIEKIANHLPVKAKAGLMKLTYDDLVMLQKFHLDEYYQLLRKVAANKYRGRCEGEEITLEVFIQYLDYRGISYSQKNFLAYISKRSFPVKYLKTMKEIIEDELVEIDEEEEQC